MTKPPRTLLAALLCLALPGAQALAAAPLLRIGGPPNISLLLTIATKHGFFAREGLNAQFRTLQGGKVSFDAVTAGQVDICAVTDANIALIGRHGLGNTKVIGSIMTKLDDGVVARRDAGIATPKNLEGKRIGYTPAGTSEVFLDLLLRHAGVDTATVTFKPLTAPAMAAALQYRGVDAVSVWQPFRLNIANRLGADAVQFDNDGVYKAHILLIATATTIGGRADDLRRVFAALARAATFARANPQAAQKLVAPELGVDPAALAASWHDYIFAVGDTKTLAADLDAIDAAVGASEPDRGAATPDYASLFDFTAEDQALAAATKP